MTWNIRFFSKKDDIRNAFRREIDENSDQFKDAAAAEQASAAYEVASKMIHETALLGDDVEEVEVSLGGHANPDRVPGFALPYVSVSVRGTKYPEPVQDDKPPTE